MFIIIILFRSTVAQGNASLNPTEMLNGCLKNLHQNPRQLAYVKRVQVSLLLLHFTLKVLLASQPASFKIETFLSSNKIFFAFSFI